MEGYFMSKLEFDVSNKLEIIWNDNYYKCNIEDSNEKNVFISIPTVDGSFVPLAKGDRVEALYYDERCLYKFDTVVTGRKVKAVPVILLKIPHEIEKIQRRKFVRVPCVQYINYTKLSDINIEEIIKDNCEDRFNKAILLDLSGGGMKLKISQEVYEDDRLAVYLSLDDEKLLVKGNIVRVAKDDDKFICGLSFFELGYKIREKIIQFIFKLMRDQRKKG
jgi:c-di-GMP-binding flagellar brake protein YcgR